MAIIVPSIGSLIVFVASPFPPVPLLMGISPFTNDLWVSGLRLRDIVQAVAVYAHRWRTLDFAYLWAIPTFAFLCFSLIVAIEEPALVERALHQAGGWVRLGMVAAILGALSVFLVRKRTRIRLYFRLGWLQKLLGQPDVTNRQQKKASEVDLLTLPYLAQLYPFLPCFYWPLFGALLVFLFPGPDRGYASAPGIIGTGVFLMVLGLPIIHLWNLQRKIDARVQWLLTTGEEEFNRRMRKRFGDSI